MELELIQEVMDATGITPTGPHAVIGIPMILPPLMTAALAMVVMEPAWTLRSQPMQEETTALGTMPTKTLARMPSGMTPISPHLLAALACDNFLSKNDLTPLDISDNLNILYENSK